MQYRLKVKVTNQIVRSESKAGYRTSGNRMLTTVKTRRFLARRFVLAFLMTLLFVVTGTRASTRVLEVPFALSSDLRSEFSTRFPLQGVGRVQIEAEWKPLTKGSVPVALTMLVIQPDGTIAKQERGISSITLEVNAKKPAGYGTGDSAWTVKVLNDADPNRVEVSGKIRITVPTASRVLEDTQFTLLGSGNAQEIPFDIPGPGRLEIEASWQSELASARAAQVPLIVSLIHPGEAKTYARRQAPSPLKFDQQITDDALDRGTRWIVRVQNSTQTKVKGRIKVTYNSSL